MAGTATATQRTDNGLDASHVEAQGPFHRVVIGRDAFLCLPSALFDNIASEARDHCGTLRKRELRLIVANERTFLSWLRLAVILSIVGVGTSPRDGS
jgi:Domain of unknown function (DUF202)